MKKSVINERHTGQTPMNKSPNRRSASNVKSPLIPAKQSALKQNGEYSEHIDEEDPYKVP